MLNNSSQDPTFLKWKIASELFTQAGVPSPEVSFGRVSFNGRSLGLYLLVEPTDKKFLRKHFSDDRGNLYEGDNQDVTDQLDRDNGEGADTQSDRQRLAETCLEPDFHKRWSKLNQTLDVDRFLSFMATEVLVDHRDGYSMDRNNFRLYHNPADDRFVFIPHGLDGLFNSTALTPSRHFSSLIASSLLEMPEGKQGYNKRHTELARNFFSSEKVLKRIDELWEEIRKEAPAETVSAVIELKTTVKVRIRSVQQQH